MLEGVFFGRCVGERCVGERSVGRRAEGMRECCGAGVGGRAEVRTFTFSSANNANLFNECDQSDLGTNSL